LPAHREFERLQDRVRFVVGSQPVGPDEKSNQGLIRRLAGNDGRLPPRHYLLHTKIEGIGPLVPLRYVDDRESLLAGRQNDTIRFAFNGYDKVPVAKPSRRG
jgi:hypothetical protein